MKYLHPITKQEITKKELFEIMFGKEFMESNNKGQIREYDDIQNNIQLSLWIRRNRCSRKQT